MEKREEKQMTEKVQYPSTYLKNHIEEIQDKKISRQEKSQLKNSILEKLKTYCELYPSDCKNRRLHVIPESNLYIDETTGDTLSYELYKTKINESRIADFLWDEGV